MNKRRRDYQQARRRYKKKTGRQDAYQQEWQEAQDQTPGLGFNGDLDRVLSGYQREADVSRTNLAETRGQLFSQYFDPNNPFSQQALLEKSINDQQAGQVGNYASRGRLYSGGLEHAGREDAFLAQQARDSLNRGYAGMVTDAERENTQRVRGLTGQAEQAIYDQAQHMGQNIAGTDIPSKAALGQTKAPRKPKRKDYGLAGNSSSKVARRRRRRRRQGGNKFQRPAGPNDKLATDGYTGPTGRPW